MDLKILIDEIMARPLSNNDIENLSVALIEDIFTKSELSHEEFKKFVIKYVLSENRKEIMMFAESVSSWMINSNEKHARVQGTKLLNWLAAYTADNQPVSVMYNTAIEQLKPGNPSNDTRGATAILKKCLDKEQGKTRLRSMILNTLGDSYRLGRGVEQNLSQSLECYMEAAELRCGEAAYNAGLHFDGKITLGKAHRANSDMAAHYYNLAMDNGVIKGQTNLGILHIFEMLSNSDVAYGKNLLKMASADGDSVAAEALGMFESLGIAPKENMPESNSRRDFEILSEALFHDRQKPPKPLEQMTTEERIAWAQHEMESFAGGSTGYTADHMAKNYLLNVILDGRSAGEIDERNFDMIVGMVRTAPGRQKLIAFLSEQNQVKQGGRGPMY